MWINDVNQKQLKLKLKFFIFISKDIMVMKSSRYQSKSYKKRKVGNLSRGWPENSLFNSYYTEVLGRALLLFLDCFTLSLMPTL